MPSIEQCETASGSLAAMPSTLDFFDKFKCISSVSEDGKDSDSEESFHLPLDDDDMESQSVVSNGRDKEIHNEETEDDILNKFETVPSGTPDHLDSHIEDSILDDDNVIGKESDSKSSDNAETNVDSLKDQNKAPDTVKVEIKLKYDFEEYEDSGDGEFKSIYETDEAAESIVEELQDEIPTPVETATESIVEEIQVESPKLTESIIEEIQVESPKLTETATVEEPSIVEEPAVVKEPQDESPKPTETVEPMEISDEPEIVECPSDHQPLQESVHKVAATLDNFEDSMEVEDDTNQDIANIIEKLEDQDTPMEDVESSALNDGSDVNMAESCEDAALPSDSIDNSEKTTVINNDISEAVADEVEENSDDVEMTGENENKDEPKESCKENIAQVGINESAEVAATFQESPQVAATFQEPLETPKVATEEDPGKAAEQDNIDIKEERLEIETGAEKEDKKGEDSTENVKILEDSVKEEFKESENSAETSNSVALEEKLETQIEETSTEILEENLSKNVAELEKEENMATAACDNDKLLEQEETNKENENSIKNQTNDLQNDDLLMELDKTINESSTEEKAQESTGNDKAVENAETEAPKEPAKDIEETQTALNKDVFKTPVEVPKCSEEAPAHKEEKDGPDLQSEKSNDKTDEDESDLLDISMVRETEEDDACAIADALKDKDALVSEKSDEEQSERVETEQEGSDVDKDNDNDPTDFDDTDDDSRAGEADDSSNAGSTKDKIGISESSKDSSGESEPKRRKKSVESFTDASNDASVVEGSATESAEDSEKMDIPDSLVPDTSVNLESTLVQDEAVPTASEKEDFIPPAPSEKESKNEDKESNKTDASGKKTKEVAVVEEEPTANSLPEKSKSTDSNSELRKSPFNKRTHSATDIEETGVAAKKPKLAPAVVTEAPAEKEAAEKTVPSKKIVEKDSEKIADKAAEVNEKVKTLTEFTKFMQCRRFSAKLSRSDLEQFCIQKICESLMLKSSEGELHQTIKKHEKTIDNLRKDLLQLTKQCKDLEIVNKKLMNELRSQTAQKKPLVPLKITRSVGLQVRLNPGNDAPNANRRRQMTASTTTPQKPVVNSTTPTANRTKVTTGNAQPTTVVRQVLQNSPQKSPLTTGQTTTNNVPPNPLLSQALQQQKPRQVQAVAAKRTATPVRKEPAKPGNPGVIDLTDEDDKSAATKPLTGNTIKIVNKTISPANPTNKTLISKVVPGKANQGKQVGVQKAVTVGQNKGTTLSQGIRLTPTSVITSSSGSPQMVYVVPTITSNAGGTQKVAFVNFQPTNGVLSGAINGSTVSVMSNKGQTLTLKPVASPLRNKHPAPLPPPPRIITPDPKLKSLLPKPHLTIKKIDTGIILQWKMPYNLEQYESIASYQLYAYQETSAPPSTDMWRKVGDVKALALPMACTLTQFADKNKYYFAVRSVDVHKRIGAFSDPEEISL